MKFAITTLITALLWAAPSVQAQTLPGTNISEKTFAMDITTLEAPSLSLAELVDGIEFMNAYIGSYPPRYKSEAHRQEIYEKWLVLIAEAEAYYEANQEAENAYYVRAELYRQGHNMDVAGSADKAFENIEACLKNYKTSVACNFSAQYFYLSIAPVCLEEAEASLAILREHFKPNLVPDVEAGYVFLYLFAQDYDRAAAQINIYIGAFPETRRAGEFKKILSAIKTNNVKMVTD